MGINKHLVNRGDIWLVKLDPVVGHEMRKTRPAVVLQNNEGNLMSDLTIVAPITSKQLNVIYPFQFLLRKTDSKLDKHSKVLLNHLRLVDKSRLLKPLGRVPLLQMAQIDDVIRLVLDV